MRFFKLKKAKSDEELMVCLQKGDRQALSKLYEKYSPPLMRYFYKMLWQHEALAQDCLQDLFEKIIHKQLLFDSNKNFKVWIYAIAYNICKNQYRTNERQPTFDSLSVVSFANNSDTPVDTYEQKLLQQGIQQLGEAHKTAFLLRYEQEVAIKDIAAIMECSEGTVKSRLFYAKKQLAKQLEEINPYR